MTTPLCTLLGPGFNQKIFSGSQNKGIKIWLKTLQHVKVLFRLRSSSTVPLPELGKQADDWTCFAYTVYTLNTNLSNKK